MLTTTPRSKAMTILQIKSSLFTDGGQSSQLADNFVARVKQAIPGTRLVVRDVAADPIPHLTAERFGAFLSKPEERTADQRRSSFFRRPDRGAQARHVVMGLPMYNFGVPSTLKAYFIASPAPAGRSATPRPVGRLAEQKAIVFAPAAGCGGARRARRRRRTCGSSWSSSASPTSNSCTRKDSRWATPRSRLRSRSAIASYRIATGYGKPDRPSCLTRAGCGGLQLHSQSCRPPRVTAARPVCFVRGVQ